MKRFETKRLRGIFQGILIGLIVGLVVSAFRALIEWGLNLVRHGYETLTLSHVLIALAGAFVLTWGVGQLLKQEPGISGSGIPQVEGQLQNELDYSWFSILWRKFVGGVFAIGSGLFLGREGPSIQLGAAVGQGLGEVSHATPTQRRVMISSGAAAGLSAAFNAPIAGTLFVLEEIYHNFSPVIWLSGLASALTADFVSANVFGQTPVLHLVYARSLPLPLYWHLLVLGIILGLLGFGYQKVLLALPSWYHHLPLPQHYWGLVPFLAMIPLGFWRPNLIGGGNAVIISFNTLVPTVGVLLIMFILRFVFSMVAYGSGLPGGIFLPILSLGAIIGAVYGQVMVSLHLLPTAYVMNLIIFSMAAYFAAIGKAPFTAILLITEMVGNLQHLMPMAVLSLVAYVTVDVLGGAPIYESLLARLLPHQATDGPMLQLELPVFAGSRISGQAVGAIAWPPATLLVGIQRGQTQLVPHGDTVMHAGDLLQIHTAQASARQVRRLLQQAGSEKD